MYIEIPGKHIISFLAFLYLIALSIKLKRNYKKLEYLDKAIYYFSGLIAFLMFIYGLFPQHIFYKILLGITAFSVFYLIIRVINNVTEDK